jgi:uroporphyrinogen decarboxylase
MWLDYYFDNYRKLIDLAHSYSLKVMVHSCGAISEILGDMIEAGVDIIDPVQTTAVGMEAAAIKEKFGVDIVFHGAIDTQQVLPTETPKGVYRHTVDTMRTLGRNGGYIFAPCNNIQSDTPAANVDAMYNAAKEYRS